MNSLVLLVLKISLLMFYIATPMIGAIEPLADYQQSMVYITVILLVAHLGEYVVIKKRLAQLADNKSNHFIQTLLFGFLYWLPLFRAQQQTQ